MERNGVAGACNPAGSGSADRCAWPGFNEALLLGSRDAGPLHQTRVALRRLRSAFSIFRPVIGGERQVTLRKELRWVAAELGKARDLDVLLGRSGPGTVHDRAAPAREAAYDRVQEVLGSARVRMLMLDLAEWTALADWVDAPDTEIGRGQPARDFAAVALDRFRRKVKRDGHDLAYADDAARHEVRKDAKKLRYGAEFFVSLFDTPREQRRHVKFTAALEKLQDKLGALNDLATVPQVLDALGLVDDPAAAPLLARGKRKKLLKTAVKAQNDLIDAKKFWR